MKPTASNALANSAPDVGNGTGATGCAGSEPEPAPGWVTRPRTSSAQAPAPSALGAIRATLCCRPLAGARAVRAMAWRVPARPLQPRRVETRAVNSSTLERNSFSVGDVFALWCATTSGMVGTSPPLIGLATTDQGRKFSA